jgi:hypothetical protein
MSMKARLNSLGGWQRLWLLATVVIGLYFAVWVPLRWYESEFFAAVARGIVVTLVISAIVYFLGWLVGRLSGWILRGFRQHKDFWSTCRWNWPPAARRIEAGKIMDLCGVYYPDRIGR